tara:strand:+ start:5837 stop:6067 length:231 start_codon:yes stop_codon:yes gene_type:complete
MEELVTVDAFMHEGYERGNAKESHCLPAPAKKRSKSRLPLNCRLPPDYSIRDLYHSVRLPVSQSDCLMMEIRRAAT